MVEQKKVPVCAMAPKTETEKPKYKHMENHFYTEIMFYRKRHEPHCQLVNSNR